MNNEFVCEICMKKMVLPDYVISKRQIQLSDETFHAGTHALHNQVIFSACHYICKNRQCNSVQRVIYFSFLYYYKTNTTEYVFPSNILHSIVSVSLPQHSLSSCVCEHSGQHHNSFFHLQTSAV